jgi:voltage-gated potassium channel
VVRDAVAAGDTLILRPAPWRSIKAQLDEEGAVSERIEKHKHLLLLAAIVVLMVTQPMVAYESVAARILHDLVVAVVAAGVLFVVFGERWEKWTGVVLAVPAVILTIALYTVPNRSGHGAQIAYHLAVALYFGFAVLVIVRDIFRRRAITFDEIFGAFAGYLLLGVAWGSLYGLLELTTPGSFSLSPDIRWQLDYWHLRRALFNYVSFATMATLGYGSVTPNTPLAHTLTWLEVIVAQFYLAVVIAQIVGMKIARVVAQLRE